MDSNFHFPQSNFHSDSINVASSSSNPYPDFSRGNHSQYQQNPMNTNNRQPQHHPNTHNQLPQIRQMSSSQWPQQSYPSSQLHQHSQQFNQSWQNQMQSQSYPSTLPSLGGFNNMSLIPQQVINDAWAMSSPVTSLDEPFLLRALVDCRSRQGSFKDALNGLHGKNGHSASLWKDYYLDHKDRLDSLIRSSVDNLNGAPQTAKKPVPGSYNVDRFSTSATAIRGGRREQPTVSHHSSQAARTPPAQSNHPNHPPQPAGSRRSTINSLTTHTPVYDDRLPPPNADIKIPDPPSRSPSPPTKVVPQGRGNKYTPEDRDFFLKFISWRLKLDPTLTRNDLCVQLAEKAPHHTAQSWASHWSNRHDVPDKILAAARGEEYVSADEDAEDSDSGSEEVVPVRRRPKYREPSSGDEPSPTPEQEPSDDDSGPLRVWEEKDMGGRGESFTEADLYITAKHVLSIPNFKLLSAKDKWGAYSDRFPQRSAKSWAEYYRRNEKAVDKIVRRLQAQEKGGNSTKLEQVGRPSWVGSREGEEHGKSKRKHYDDEDEEKGGSSKRGRTSTPVG